MVRIGVLALQGAFAEHLHMLKQLGADGFEIRQASDFTPLPDGLILPGGESTVISKLMMELGLFEPIRQAVQNGLPVFGTCAGMILLAKKTDDASVPCLDALDATVRRNAYGRQLGSFQTMSAFQGVGDIPMVFIRAPYLTDVSESVDVLAQVDGKIVAARQNNILSTAFHPELTGDTRVHAYFLKMIREL